MKKFSLVSLFLLLSLLVTAILPAGNALADDLVKGAAVPTPISPEGIITNRTPTLTWEKVSEISSYEVKVIQYKTTVFLKIVNCTTSECNYTPSYTLDYQPYTWSVRVSGSANVWSNPLAFTISSPSFTSGFNGTTKGWDRYKDVGAPWNASTTYVKTKGLSSYWSPYYRYLNGGKYNDFDFTVKVRRIGGKSGDEYPANCLMARMGTYVNKVYYWYPGYRFCIANNGKYEIWYKGLGDSDTKAIATWTFSDAIHTSKDSWNTLRVQAVGSDFTFWINGVFIEAFNDTHKDRGYVGVMMYRYPATTTEFDMDFATLTVVENGTSGSSVAFEKAVLIPVTEADVIGTK